MAGTIEMKTERLTLRRYRPEDAGPLHKSPFSIPPRTAQTPHFTSYCRCFVLKYIQYSCGKTPCLTKNLPHIPHTAGYYSNRQNYRPSAMSGATMLFPLRTLQYF